MYVEKWNFLPSKYVEVPYSAWFKITLDFAENKLELQTTLRGTGTAEFLSKSINNLQQTAFWCPNRAPSPYVTDNKQTLPVAPHALDGNSITDQFNPKPINYSSAVALFAGPFSRRNVLELVCFLFDVDRRTARPSSHDDHLILHLNCLSSASSSSSS